MESNRFFCKIEHFAYGEIDERSFNNPHPREKSCGSQAYILYLYIIQDDTDTTQTATWNAFREWHRLNMGRYVVIGYVVCWIRISQTTFYLMITQFTGHYFISSKSTKTQPHCCDVRSWSGIREDSLHSAPRL